jgi:hypothetical protein
MLFSPLALQDHITSYNCINIMQLYFCSIGTGFPSFHWVTTARSYTSVLPITHMCLYVTISRLFVCGYQFWYGGCICAISHTSVPPQEFEILANVLSNTNCFYSAGILNRASSSTMSVQDFTCLLACLLCCPELLLFGLICGVALLVNSDNGETKDDDYASPSLDDQRWA